MNRCGRGGERGAETLEFLGVLPLAMVVVLLAWQGIVLVRQQAEAEADARTLARQAVLCDGGPALTLRDLDPAATGAAVVADISHQPYVMVSVALPPQTVLPDLDLARLGIPSPQAAVTMRHEPC